MKKVLVYENRKIDPTIWDISTKELEDKAFKSLFKLLRTEWEVYSDLDYPDDTRKELESCTHQCEGHKPNDYEEELRSHLYQFNLYTKAKKGDIRAIKELLNYRKDHDYEYEHWQILEVSK